MANVHRFQSHGARSFELHLILHKQVLMKRQDGRLLDLKSLMAEELMGLRWWREVRVS